MVVGDEALFPWSMAYEGHRGDVKATMGKRLYCSREMRQSDHGGQDTRNIMRPWRVRMGKCGFGSQVGVKVRRITSTSCKAWSIVTGWWQSPLGCDDWRYTPHACYAEMSAFVASVCRIESNKR